MATSVAYASNETTPSLETLILHMLPQIEELTGDGIQNSNLLTAYLNQKGAKQVVDGGQEFWAGILKAENSNGKWQGKDDTMTANSQDPSARLSFPIRIFTDSIVLNDFDKARNKGRTMIKDFLTTLREQATMSIQNNFNSAWWASTPGDNDPNSIPSLVSATPTSGTIGGLNRAGNSYLQNGAYTTAVADIGSEAGIAKLHELRIKYSAGKLMADLIVMPENLFAGLAGYLETERRYMPSDKMAKLGFDTIQLGTATIGYENTNVLGGANTITSGYVYGLCTQKGALKLKVLKDGDGKWADKFERIGQQLNQALFYYFFGNLVTNNPRVHWVATAVSTS